MTLPLAHVGHYLWVLYLVPVVIVVAGIVRSARVQRRGDCEDEPGD
jgi:cytochrome c-type biogenesis protein CcmH/NrfF